MAIKKKFRAVQRATCIPQVVHPGPQNLAAWMSQTYEELRRIADQYFQIGGPDQTLQRTSVVHESFIRLTKHGPQEYVNRAHFFAVISRSMRQVVIEYFRRRLAKKRGGGWQRVSFDKTDIAAPEARNFLALDEALTRMETFDPRMCAIVELRFFAGLSTAETALLLKRGKSTIRRDWSIAKAWLQRELESPSCLNEVR